MDAQPLMILKPEDVVEAMKLFGAWAALLAAAMGFLGWSVGSLLTQIGRAAVAIAARRPFAERVAAAIKRHDRAAQLHLRLVWRLEQRLARERERQAKQECPF